MTEREKEALALQLWRRWFKEAHRNPSVFHEFTRWYGLCFFCSAMAGKVGIVHKEDCVYLNALELIK